MNWIYEGVSGLVDKEEYLTGRKVDKTFEIAQFEKDGGNVGDFSFQENNIPSLLESSTSHLSKLDLDLRLKEDPLQEIKRNQANIIKETLTNPIKMKRIKQLLEESLRKEKEEKRARKKLKKLKKKAKKLKKERKRSLSRSSNGSADGATGHQHKRRAGSEREQPAKIKRERKDYSSESSDSRKANNNSSKYDSSKRKTESDSKDSKALPKRTSSKFGEMSKLRKLDGKQQQFNNNDRLKVKPERRSVSRDRSPSKRHRSGMKRSESSGSYSSNSSVNYSSSAPSSRSSSVSSNRSGKHRSRSKSIVRNSRNRRRSSSGSESRFATKRRGDKQSSDHRSSRDRKSDKYSDHRPAKDCHGERHGLNFDDRYRDRKPREKSREHSRDRSRDQSSRYRTKMQGDGHKDEWPEDERDMIPVIRSPVSVDPMVLARPCRKERQEQKTQRLIESGRLDSSERSDLNSLVDGVITSRYRTNFNQNHPKYNTYSANDEYRNSKRPRAGQDEDESRSARKKPNRSDDNEREMEAKRKQMMANAEWREAQRSKDVEMHVRAYERDEMEVQSSLNKNYSTRYY